MNGKWCHAGDQARWCVREHAAKPLTRKTELVSKLSDIRNRAIENGMPLLSEDEVLAVKPLTWKLGPVSKDTGERYLLKRVDDKGDVWYDLDTFIPAEDGWNRVVAHIPLADILALIGGE